MSNSTLVFMIIAVLALAALWAVAWNTWPIG